MKLTDLECEHTLKGLKRNNVFHSLLQPPPQKNICPCFLKPTKLSCQKEADKIYRSLF